MRSFYSVFNPTSRANMAKPFLFPFEQGEMIFGVSAQSLLVITAEKDGARVA